MPKSQISRIVGEQRQSRDDNNGQYINFFDAQDNEIDEHYKDTVNDWWNKLPADQRIGVREYTGSTYTQMNNYLRKNKFGKGENPYIEKLIRDCERGIAKQKLPESVMVWRKSSAQLLEKLGLTYAGDPEAFVKETQRRVGSTVKDKGFTSTSTKTNRWSGSVHYEIKIPKGASAAYVNQISEHEGEMEIIINRGTIYRVTGARTQYIDGGMRPVVELEIVKRTTK